MKKYIENIILIFIFLGFTALYISNDSRSPYCLISDISNMVSAFLLFFYTAIYWVGNLRIKIQNRKYLFLLGGIMAISWAVNSILFTLYVSDIMTGGVGGVRLYFDPVIQQVSLSATVLPVLMGIFYGILRGAVIEGKKKMLKKVAVCSGLAVFLLVAGLAGKYWYDVSYRGNDEMKFLDTNQELKSLDEILSRPELQGKPVFIDLWYATCGPCKRAFANGKVVQKILAEEGVITVYLGRETAHTNSKQKWINVIKEYKLKGWHVYMSNEVEKQIAAELGRRNIMFAYPHYLLADQTGAVRNWDVTIQDWNNPEAYMVSADSIRQQIRKLFPKRKPGTESASL